MLVKSKGWGLIILILTLLPSFLWTNEAAYLLQSGIDSFLSGSINEAADILNEVGSDYANSELIRSRSKLWLGRVAIGGGDVETAERFLSESASLAASAGLSFERSNGNNKNLAEAYRVNADALAEIMLFKGVPYIIKNGGKVQELAEKSLANDPGNPDAAVIYAQGRINAPRLFGGNRNEGISILSDLWLNRLDGNLSKAQIFRVAVALGDTYLKKDPDKAEEYYYQAALLFPDNQYIKNRTTN
ncbi:MAG: hypothetical protein JEY99_11870 [Spirochaetales bacterium]|nr:hypothetical protein [Spirochaetales bacterium]